MQTLQIGNVTLKNNLILGPMAGVTDLPFRILCSEQGAGLLCMEMVSAKGILYNNRNTKAMLAIDEREHPVSLQLFGSDPQIMGDMAKRLVDEGVPFDILDINMGCPVPKVVNNGEGSALMGTHCRREWGISRSSAWKNKGTVLFRKSRLGHHSKSKRNRKDSGHWKWRYLNSSRCDPNEKTDRLRRIYDRQRSTGKSMDFPRDFTRTGNRRTP